MASLQPKDSASDKERMRRVGKLAVTAAAPGNSTLAWVYIDHMIRFTARMANPVAGDNEIIRTKSILFEAGRAYEPHLEWPSQEKINEAEALVSNHEKSTKSLLVLKTSFCDTMVTKCIIGDVCIFRVAHAMIDWNLAKSGHEIQYRQAVSYFADSVPADPADHQIRIWCDRMDDARVSRTIANRIVGMKLLELEHAGIRVRKTES